MTLASAAAEPDALYTGSDGFEAGEFKRTASRLIEMRSEGYLAGRMDRLAASGSSDGPAVDAVAGEHAALHVVENLGKPVAPGA